MISCKFVAAAETIIRDGETNSISIINVLENVNSPSYPILLPKLSVLWILKRTENDPEIFDAEIIFKIGEHELNRFPLGINFQGSIHTRNIAALNGYVITEPGILTIELKMVEVVLSTYSIDLLILNEPEINVANA